MGSRRHHHVVSRGYQRLFAVGELISLRRRSGGPSKVVGTRDAFARKDFNSYRDDEGESPNDELEEQWASVESGILPMVRALIEGEEHPNLREAVKVLAAMHWARSYSFDRAIASVVADSWNEAPGRLAVDPEMLRVFRIELGRDPGPGEIEAIVDERFAAHFGGAGPFRIDRMANAYNHAIEKLRPLHVQLIRLRSTRVPFIFSDTPVLHFDQLRVGWRDRLALGDATHLYIPLAPWMAAMFTTNRENDEVVAPSIVQKMNQLMWRGSWNFVAGHPGTDFNRAIP